MPDEPMLDRLRRRAAAADHFAGCRRIETYIEGGVEWTIAQHDERGSVLLALGDGEPVELSIADVAALMAALQLRAAALSGIPPAPGRP